MSRLKIAVGASGLMLLIALIMAMVPGKDTSTDTRDSREQKKAVLEASQENGIRLSEKAVARLELNYLKVTTDGSLALPEKAVVRSLSKVGVYRLRDGWFKLLPIQVSRGPGAGHVVARTAELKSGDQVVVQGVALLRAAEIYAFGGEQ